MAVFSYPSAAQFVFPAVSGGGSGVTSLDGITGDVTLVAGTGITITDNSPSPGNITITGTASGANTTLSNLTSPTAINKDLFPDVDDTRLLGGQGIAFTSAYANGFYSSSASNYLEVGFGSLDLVSADGGISITNNDSSGQGISLSTTGNTTTSGNISLTTGGGPATTSGNISLVVGNAATTQGTIQLFKAGVPSSVGDVWTATDTSGHGYWATPAASGANTALSNLTSTSINQSLISDTPATYDLGALTNFWNNGYIQTVFSNAINDGTGNIAFDVASRLAFDTSLAQSFDFEARQLDDSAGTPVFDWATAGNVSSFGNMNVRPVGSGPGAVEKSLILFAKNNTNSISIKAAATSVTTHTLILPSAQGAANTSLTNNGSGTLSWSAVSLTAGVTGTLPVANGGTGVASLTTYSPIVGGTTTTGAVQQVTSNMGTSGAVLKTTGTSSLPVWSNISTSVVSALTDEATPALDASLGTVFTLTSTTNPTIAVPSNPVSGQKIVISFTASGASRTLALNSGTGGFSFGSDITSLTATPDGTTDYVGCIYNVTANKWHVVSYSKGF